MNNKGKISLKTIIYFIVIIIIILIGKSIYSKYNFYDYIKGVREEGKTSFTRDSSVVCSDADSYKIENKDYNDAIDVYKRQTEMARSSTEYILSSASINKNTS